MKIHKEGKRIILITFILLLVLDAIFFILLPHNIVMHWIVVAASIIFFLAVVSFFRIPKRQLLQDEYAVIAPADGEVVVIEETYEPEYFKDKRLQISIFMSPANVHVNLNPVSGEVKYSQYHKGKYLVAWHPKSSTENERHTVVLSNSQAEILVKQIAGAVARRIINYLKVGQQVQQNSEMGFIKFGSRVDILLPLGTEVKIKLKQRVKSGQTVLAVLNNDVEGNALAMPPLFS